MHLSGPLASASCGITWRGAGGGRGEGGAALSGWGYSLTPLSGGVKAVPRSDPHHTKISLEENGSGVQGRECFSLLRKNPGPSMSPEAGMVNPDLMPRSRISSQPGLGFDGTEDLCR